MLRILEGEGCVRRAGERYLASRALSPPLSDFEDVLSVLEFHEVELVEEPLASKQAVTAFGKFRHEAGCCHECRSAESSHFDLDRVKVDRATLARDNAADVPHRSRFADEIDAQEVSDFGRENVAVRAAVNERFISYGRCTGVAHVTQHDRYYRSFDWCALRLIVAFVLKAHTPQKDRVSQALDAELEEWFA